MTHPKRPFSAASNSYSASASAAASAAAAGANRSSSSFSPFMKKARPFPLEKDKNGLQSTADPVLSASDAMLLDQQELLRNDASGSMAGFVVSSAANLSRKKATPPQPAAKKQLVIKLVKVTN